MTETNSRIHANVMRRVRTIHFARLISNAAAAGGVLGVSLYLIGREVFVAQIFRNMPSTNDYAALFRFVESAFLHAEFLVQALTVLTAVAGVWLARECVRLLTPEGRYT